MVDFGERLRELRKQKKLTQKQLAALIGVKNSVISFYEMGEHTPSPEVIVRLAAALHTTTDYLLGLDRKETVDISDLDSGDIELVRSLVDTLRQKNEKIRSL